MVNRLISLLGRRKSPKIPGRPIATDLKLRFREFKYLLRANNEALTIIHDIQRHSGDGSLMGLDFLRSRYIDASAKVYKMIRHLNTISGGRYPQLFAAFNKIHTKIDAALEEAGGKGRGLLVATLETLKPGREHLVGNKAARLAELAADGLPVPPGFVVTTAAFHRFMDYAGLAGQLRQALMLVEDSGPREIEAFSALLQKKILNAHLPPELEMDILRLAKVLAGHGDGGKLSFRSSALGEDSFHSFAGLYRSLLGVDPEDSSTAYRQVVAALYAPEAVAYRRQSGLLDQDAEMAVLVQPMLAPKSSGVVYSTDPLGGGCGPLLVSAVAGLGKGLVDGTRQPDLYRISRAHPPALLDYQPADRDRPGQPLTHKQALELARLALELEERFGSPQDIEWALTPDDSLVVLQSRPLQILAAQAPQPEPFISPLFSGGETARPGAGAGNAFIVKDEKDLAGFPQGAVLVAMNSSPAYAAALPRAAAIVTDVGGVAGHMAALARELGVPALVGTGRATSSITPGQSITVDATGRRVYPGRVEQVLGEAPSTRLSQSRPQPKPPWRDAAELITKLNLTDTRSAGFRAENCASFHDILRLAHELSFQEMFRLGDLVGGQPGEARKLEARLPFELWIIDLGGGVSGGAGQTISPGQVTSSPAKAFLKGLTDKAVNWNSPRPVSVGGLVSVFGNTLLSPPQQGLRELGQRAYAIVSAEYLNFNCRVGYHYTALDGFCGPVQNDNYISFRFHGGAASEERRGFRCELIRRLLVEIDFAAEVEGDQVSAFMKKYPAQRILDTLEELGRLILFTRQMDMLINGRPMVDRLARAFAEKDYNLAALGKEGCK